MIFVDRYAKDETGAEIRPDDAWFDLAEADTKTALAEGAKHVVKGTYGDDRVKRALEKLFHDKCAYCEWSPTAGSDWDVEHYRPKGKVAENDQHPGYYWLAYDWENLYLSCKHCNQARKDRARWGDASTAAGPSRGKMDQFPLADESRRAMSPQDAIEDEEPLLLDPNVDLPEEYLTFDATGQVHPIDDDPRATATIEICHLSRKRLTDDRGKVILRVAKLLTLHAAAKHDPTIADGLREILDDLCADAAEFAGVARCVQNDPGAFGV